jgi:hypothetical protein
MGFSMELASKMGMGIKLAVNFTPVWYPNGTYTTYTRALDAWTPAGMLSANLAESIQISGSVFDDWHISKLR